MGRRPYKHQPRPLFAKEWRTCYEQFIAQLPSVRTRELYDCVLRQFFADGIPPDKKTRAQIEAFLAAPTRSTPGRPAHVPAAATQNGRLRTIKSFYSWCSRYLVPFRSGMRPILRIRPDSGIKKRKEPYSHRDMEDGEAAALLDAIDTSTVLGARDYALLFALLVTGRRLNEICRLRWGDLVPTTFVEDGKMRQGYLYHFQGKGHLSADDFAEWPAECMEALRDYLELAGQWGHLDAGDPLFVSIAGGRGAPCEWPRVPVRGNTIDRRFRKYAAVAGLPPERVIHSLRHESAWLRYCEYCKKGKGILEVRDDLRHSRVETTMGYIGHRKRREQADTVAGAIGAQFRR